MPELWQISFNNRIGEERMKSKEKLSDIAPIGQVWVCGACGKYSTNRYNVGDVSCYVNAVLCYEDSLKIKDGRVVSARAIKEKEND